MLTIRTDQMAVFEERTFNAFAPEAIEHLRTELQELTAELPDEALLDRVRACMPVAATYGFSNRPEIMAFVDATYLLDDVRFDLDPVYWWAQEILNCVYMTSMEKAIQLLDCAFVENQLSGEE